jgi:hypothetical protein
MFDIPIPRTHTPDPKRLSRGVGVLGVALVCPPSVRVKCLPELGCIDSDQWFKALEDRLEQNEFLLPSFTTFLAQKVEGQNETCFRKTVRKEERYM